MFFFLLSLLKKSIIHTQSSLDQLQYLPFVISNVFFSLLHNLFHFHFLTKYLHLLFFLNVSLIIPPHLSQNNHTLLLKQKAESCVAMTIKSIGVYFKMFSSQRLTTSCGIFTSQAFIISWISGFTQLSGV